jgi:thiopurine S-methyltransferase
VVDHQHWLDRWKENRIGFHESSINRHLQNWFPRLAPRAGGTVFLPLCGKALDIHWIAQQGYDVIGVELSAIAVEAFFDESELPFERSEIDGFSVYQSSRIRLLQGDFFDLRAHHLDGCGLVYDRAALIAMSPSIRPRYYEHMLSIVPADCNMLLVTLEYEQAEMSGPPFSVPADEVHDSYRDAFTIDRLGGEDIIDEQPRWRKAGLSGLRESVFGLTR